MDGCTHGQIFTQYSGICHGLKWLPINISNATTNQKHGGVMEERKARRFGQGGVWGKHDSIVLGAIELRGNKN
jgi:hypothetical protein